MRWIFLMGMIVITITSFGQNKSGFILNGHLKDLKDKTAVYLVWEEDTVGKAISKGGQFQFKGHVKGGADFYFIYLDSNVNKLNSNALWLENKEMSLTGSADNISNLDLQGSVSHKEYMEILAISANTKVELRDAAFKEYIKVHPNSLYITNLIVRMIPKYSTEELKSLYGALSPAAKSTVYGKQLGNEVKFQTDNGGYFGKNPVGTIIPNFKVGVYGEGIENIHNLLAKNKVTLIDFWASWCVPCREMIPKMKSVYDEYKSKGFEILGLSIDQKVDSWIKAVKDDKTTWTHSIDSIANSHKNIFSLSAVPGYLIVDNTGKILYADFISASVKVPQSSLHIYDSLRTIVSQYLQ